MNDILVKLLELLFTAIFILVPQFKYLSLLLLAVVMSKDGRLASEDPGFWSHINRQLSNI